MVTYTNSYDNSDECSVCSIMVVQNYGRARWLHYLMWWLSTD